GFWLNIASVDADGGGAEESFALCRVVTGDPAQVNLGGDAGAREDFVQTRQKSLVVRAPIEIEHLDPHWLGLCVGGQERRRRARRIAILPATARVRATSPPPAPRIVASVNPAKTAASVGSPAQQTIATAPTASGASTVLVSFARRISSYRPLVGKRRHARRSR